MINQKNKISCCNSLIISQLFCFYAADAQPVQKNCTPILITVHISRLNDETRAITLTLMQSNKENTKNEMKDTILLKAIPSTSLWFFAYMRVLEKIKCLIHTPLSPIPDDPPYWDLSMF